ncbi:c-type lectin domain containing protein [Aphelenchoides avenae]|nr:c-type lectin domain containing protein [Aphelenchus avenae]
MVNHAERLIASLLVGACFLAGWSWYYCNCHEWKTSFCKSAANFSSSALDAFLDHRGPEVRLTVVNNIFIISGPSPVELQRPQAVQDDVKPVSFNANLTWAQARADCIRHDAKLVSIHSAEENTFILKLASSPPFTVVDWNDGVWIGLRRDESTGQCCAIGKCPDANCFVGKWEDGRVYRRHANEQRDRVLWASGEPWNRFDHRSENCVQLLATNTTKMRDHELRFANKWNDYYCDRAVRSHICEKPSVV